MKILLICICIVIVGCGDGYHSLHSAPLSSESGETSLTIIEKAVVPIGHQCNIANSSSQRAEEIDYTESKTPAIAIKRRYIEVFRELPNTSSKDREEQIKKLLGTNRLKPNQISIGVENIVCIATKYDLGKDMEEGKLPLQELLEQECPELKNHSFLEDIDSDLEQDLADKIRRDFELDEYEDFSQAFQVEVIDMVIENSIYANFTIDLRIQNGSIEPVYSENQKVQIDESEVLVRLNYSGGVLCEE